MVQKLPGRHTKGAPLFQRIPSVWFRSLLVAIRREHPYFKGYPPYGSEASWPPYEGRTLISKDTLRMVQKLPGRHTKGPPLFQRIPSVWFKSFLVAIRRAHPYIKEYPPYGSEARLPKYGCETRKTSFPAVKAKNPRRPGKDGGAKQHFSPQSISRFKAFLASKHFSPQNISRLKTLLASKHFSLQNTSHFTRYSSFTRPSSSS